MSKSIIAEKDVILVVEDDDLARRNLEHILRKENYDVVSAATGEQAVSLIEKKEFDLVITDLKMKRVDGLQVLKKVRTLHPHTEVIMITAYATVDSAVEAMRHGAYHYIPKPYKLDLVRKLVGEALLKRRLYLENLDLKKTLAEIRDKGKPLIVGSSKSMHDVVELIHQVAPTDANVLILGETGTGKELAAKAIHDLSGRSRHRFVAFNCGAFTEELLGNELFGHEKDAFTGATTQKIGLIEAADKGTVFLDEIGDMPLGMQIKLLRAIEEKEVLRLGATKPQPVDVRFLAATTRDLRAESEAGNFRADLYYRLNIVTIHMPPLTERKEDIPLLAHHFLDKKCKLIQKDIKSIDPEAMKVILRYSWPGNVRELENIMERAVILAGEESIKVENLPEDLLTLSVQTFHHSGPHPPTLEDQEIAYIKWVLEHTSWNKTRAAEVLGIDRASLWRKMKRYGIEG